MLRVVHGAQGQSAQERPADKSRRNSRRDADLYSGIPPSFASFGFIDRRTQANLCNLLRSAIPTQVFLFKLRAPVTPTNAMNGPWHVHRAGPLPPLVVDANSAHFTVFLTIFIANHKDLSHRRGSSVLFPRRHKLGKADMDDVFIMAFFGAHHGPQQQFQQTPAGSATPPRKTSAPRRSPNAGGWHTKLPRGCISKEHPE